MNKKRGQCAPTKHTAIWEQMEVRGISAKDLAGELNLSLPQIYRIISGQCMPHPLQARVLRDLLGLSWEDTFSF